MTLTKELQVGNLKQFTLTMGFREQDFSTSPISIPTSEPATAQVSYTIQQSDMPTITPSLSMGNVVALYVTGKNSKLFVGNANITYTIYKNGASVTTSNTTVANTQNCHGQVHWRWKDVQVGDVLEVKMWTTTTTATDMTIDYSNIRIYGNLPDIGNVIGKNKLLKDVKFTITNNPAPTISSPIGAGSVTTGWNLANTGAWYIYPISSTGNYFSFSIAFNFPLLAVYYASGITGIIRSNYGDGAGSSTQAYSHTSLRQYQVNAFVSGIEFRELR